MKPCLSSWFTNLPSLSDVLRIILFARTGELRGVVHQVAWIAVPKTRELPHVIDEATSVFLDSLAEAKLRKRRRYRSDLVFRFGRPAVLVEKRVEKFRPLLVHRLEERHGGVALTPPRIQRHETKRKTAASLVSFLRLTGRNLSA